LDRKSPLVLSVVRLLGAIDRPARVVDIKNAAGVPFRNPVHCRDSTVRNRS
jgi:hypothetical protein